MATVVQQNIKAITTLDGTNGTAESFLKSALWFLFNAEKDQTIKVKIFGIPMSLKVSQLRQLIEMWVGPEPQ